MNGRNKKLLLFLLGAGLVVVIGYVVSWQYDTDPLTSSDWTIGPGMRPDLMTQNGEQNFLSLQQLIADTVNNNEWQLTGSSSERLYRSIVSVLLNGEGCKTFTYDSAGNLVPSIKQEFDPTLSNDNPFDSLEP